MKLGKYFRALGILYTECMSHSFKPEMETDVNCVAEHKCEDSEFCL